MFIERQRYADLQKTLQSRSDKIIDKSKYLQWYDIQTEYSGTKVRLGYHWTSN